MCCRSRRGMYYDYATARYRPKKYVDQSSGRTITSTQQTCASCGKFRSARWQAQHPVIPGTIPRPSLCGRCRDKHTSSEEERPRHRRNHHHHRRRHYTKSTDDSHNTSSESRRAARRYRSYSGDYRRRSLERSPPSREHVRIIIANGAGDRIRSRRGCTRSSSMEPVRFIRRTEVVDMPDRLPRTRSILRSSSPADSPTQYIEDWDPPGCLHRSRTLSPVSYIEDVEQPRHRPRRRSLSRASYVDELERPRCCSRPRSLSHVTYYEDSDRPRYRRRARRSSSQVHFADEIDEPVYVSKTKRLKRRRVIHYDGPPDTEKSEQEAYSHTQADRHSLLGAANKGGGAVFIEETITPHPRAPQKAIQQEQGVEFIKEQFTPQPVSRSQSKEGSESFHITFPDQYGRKPSKTRSYAYKSDDDATPPSEFRHEQTIQSTDGVEERPSHHSSYVDFERARPYSRSSYSPALESREPSRQRMFSGPEAPYRERRERLRESDESSGPDDDDYPRPSPNNYRHVTAPKRSSPHSELLVEMLQNAKITPPSTRYARGRPLQRNGYSRLDTPGQSYSRPSYPSEDSEDGHARHKSQHKTGETLEGGSSVRDPEVKRSAEYSWMN